LFSSSILSTGVIEDLPISEIKLPTSQLRSHLELEELAVSIAEKGLLQPIIVRTVDGESFYEIVAGCRRFQACKRIGRRRITCQITNLNDKEAFEVSIIENIQRMTLTPMDEAKAFKNYVSDYGWGGVTELATKLGKSVPYVTKKIMLLSLPNEVKDSIAKSALNPSVAQELVYLENEEDKKKIARLIVSKKLTTKKIRKIIKKIKNNEDVTETCVQSVTTDDVSSQKAFDRTITILKIAMYRIGNIVNELDNDWIIHEILVQHQRRIHEQIDVLIKQRKKIPRRRF
jgi:ParB family transcriptional regulator, chromosome partitioning protein